MALFRKSILALLFSLLLWPRTSFGDKGIILVGPTIHWDFGNHAHGFSYGVETSYWNFLNGIWPYSLDFGLEYGHSHFRIYSEAQASLVVIGLSLGPVLDFGGKNGTSLGWQNSVWASYLVGLDMRWRRLEGTTYYCPGVFTKLPANYDSKEWDGDGNEHHHLFHD
ncbi:MAG: hypothetical protein JWO30_630 [Fibrobacteres bacterium]|nr:hypothetical protein [Fibrobacterota bacterium]